jgi:hypothetical protein
VRGVAALLQPWRVCACVRVCLHLCAMRGVLHFARASMAGMQSDKQARLYSCVHPWEGHAFEGVSDCSAVSCCSSLGDWSENFTLPSPSLHPCSQVTPTQTHT